MTTSQEIDKPLTQWKLRDYEGVSDEDIESELAFLKAAHAGAVLHRTTRQTHWASQIRRVEKVILQREVKS